MRSKFVIAATAVLLLSGMAHSAEIKVLSTQATEKAYRELLGRYQRPVFSLIYRMVRDREQAEDLAQEVFVRAWRSIAGISSTSAMRAARSRRSPATSS